MQQLAAFHAQNLHILLAACYVHFRAQNGSFLAIAVAALHHFTLKK
jgi:hypothetical protein